MMSEKLQQMILEHVQHAKILLNSSNNIQAEFMRVYMSDDYYKKFNSWEDLLEDINKYETHSVGKIYFINQIKTIYESYKNEKELNEHKN